MKETIFKIKIFAFVTLVVSLLGFWRWEYYMLHEADIRIPTKYDAQIDALKEKIETLSNQLHEKKKLDNKTQPIANYIKQVTDNDDSIDYSTIAYHTVKNAKDPLLLIAIFKVESNFDKDQINQLGCRGLGQIHPSNFSMLKRQGIINKESDLHKIEVNIKASEFILADCLDQAKGDVKKALRLYSATDINSKYTSKVLAEYKVLKSMHKMRQSNTELTSTIQRKVLAV